jgi:hypothetical protein
MGFQEMGILRCDACGEEFFIGHNPRANIAKHAASVVPCSPVSMSNQVVLILLPNHRHEE